MTSTESIGRINYGPDFGDDLRQLVDDIENLLVIRPDREAAVESLIIQ